MIRVTKHLFITANATKIKTLGSIVVLQLTEERILDAGDSERGIEDSKLSAVVDVTDNESEKKNHLQIIYIDLIQYLTTIIKIPSICAWVFICVSTSYNLIKQKLTEFISLFKAVSFLQFAYLQ